MTEEQHQRRRRARKAMHEAAHRARERGQPAHAFEDRACADDPLIDLYDGDFHAFARELAAVLNVIWAADRCSHRAP